MFVLAGPLGSLATCAGWEMSAAARMACCRDRHDGCEGQLAADRCCGGGEQAQQPTSQVTAALVPVARIALLPCAVDVPILIRPAVAGATIISRSVTLPPHPPHLRQDVLLL